jgi:hypothetical protein
MKRKPITILAVCCCLAFTVAQSAQFDQRFERSELPLSRCTILADYGPVWVRVYEELVNGGMAWMVYDGKLDRGGKHLSVNHEAMLPVRKKRILNEADGIRRFLLQFCRPFRHAKGFFTRTVLENTILERLY